MTSSAVAADDLERGLPGAAVASSNAAGSDNTMNDEGGAHGAAVPSGTQGGDADMEFVAGSSLPPIDDARRKQMDKAQQKAAKEQQECEQFKAMTLDQKKKALDGYNPQDFYTKGMYVDAQDTTNVFMMAKIYQANQTDISVNFDGWPDKWNIVSLLGKTSCQPPSSSPSVLTLAFFHLSRLSAKGPARWHLSG